MKSAPRSQAFLQLSVSIVLNTFAFVAIKLAVDRLVLASAAPTFSALIMALRLPAFWIGGVSFVVGMYFWVQCLRTLDLSTAYPTASVSYVVVAILSYYLFGEDLTPTRIGGIALIVFGVVVLCAPKRKAPGGRS